MTGGSSSSKTVQNQQEQKRDERRKVPLNHYEEIRKRSYSPIYLRRAQSELTFDTFEKIVQRAQKSNLSSYCFNESDYKTESETLGKKLNEMKSSFSSNQHLNRLGARSFHNLLSLSCAQRRCCLALPADPNASLSQPIAYQDLKQFKSTLECVEYLSKMQINDRRANLSMRNLESGSRVVGQAVADSGVEFNLEAIKKKLLEVKRPRVRNDEDAKRDEYEKQGARPKTKSSSKKSDR